MRWRSKKGFTLIELMMGVSILLVSGLALLSGFLGSMFLNNSSNNLTIAVNDAQYVLEQIKGLDYATRIYGANLSNYYTPPTFTNPDGQVVFTSSLEKIDLSTSISQITVTINWLDKGQGRSFSLATYIAK
ncbi:MAG: type II secretion system protein [Candidatus Omnitrophota bacterium]